MATLLQICSACQYIADDLDDAQHHQNAIGYTHVYSSSNFNDGYAKRLRDLQRLGPSGDYSILDPII